MRLFKIILISCAISLTLFAQSGKGWFFLNDSDINNGTHNTRHFETLGKFAPGYNKFILKAIDKVQATALDGGGYFADPKASPPEAPIGYDLSLFGKKLIHVERKTSFCSGSSYSAFIEALNMIFKNKADSLSPEIFEAMRMQESDGSRREDKIKFWGKWNADGYGNHYALVQYSNMGKVIPPEEARPGDFMNISWKHGGGHSVVFLGWYKDKNDKYYAVYWSSQKGTNGLGDDMAPIEKIAEVMIVRLVNPQNLFKIDINKKINYKVPGFKINIHNNQRKYPTR